jgi:hypothetical protein
VFFFRSYIKIWARRIAFFRKGAFMAELSLRKPYLIIADFDYQPVLLAFKEKHPETDWKLMTKDDVLDCLSFSYAKSPIPYLLQNGFQGETWDYSRIQKTLKLLRSADFKTSVSLSQLHQLLSEKGFLQEDPYGLHAMSSRPILLFESDEDDELTQLLRRNNLAYSRIHFADLDIPETISRQPDILSFPDKFTQFCYIFSDIRRRIIRDKEDPSSLAILVGDSDDDYYLSFFSDLFGIATDHPVSGSLLSFPDAKKEIEALHEKRSFALEPERAGESFAVQKLRGIILSYELAALPFDFAYRNLLEILKSNPIVSDSESRGISILTSPSFQTGLVTYVSDFQFNDFYQVFDDDGVYPDDILKNIGINPSYRKTALDRRKKRNYLFYQKTAFVSWVRRHLDDKIFDSQFLKEEDWKDTPAFFNEKGLYPRAACDLLRSKNKDDAFLPRDTFYRSYSGAYQKLSSEIPLRSFSASTFDSYFKCPFLFYLNVILGLDRADPNVDTYPQKFGTFVHAILENVYESDFDFEAAYQNAFDRYQKECDTHNEIFTEREKVFLRVAHDRIKSFAAAIAGQCQNATITGEKAEAGVTLAFTGPHGEEISVKGRVDKIVFSKGSAKEYYTILDYKTGDTRFDLKSVFLGNSLQLPLYAMALAKATDIPELSGKDFGGFGIQKVFLKTKPPVKNNRVQPGNLKATIRIKGIALHSKDYLKSFDKTAFKKNDDLKVRSNYLDLKYGFTDMKSTLQNELSYSLSDLYSDARAAAQRTIFSVLNRDFSIAPTILKRKDEPFCSSCHYRDVCYSSASDVRCLQDDIIRHFDSDGSETDEEDEES